MVKKKTWFPVDFSLNQAIDHIVNIFVFSHHIQPWSLGEISSDDLGPVR